MCIRRSPEIRVRVQSTGEGQQEQEGKGGWWRRGGSGVGMLELKPVVMVTVYTSRQSAHACVRCEGAEERREGPYTPLVYMYVYTLFSMGGLL